MVKTWESALERCREVATDPATAVASWKDRHPDGKVVGYFPVYVPEELISAGGMLPVGVWGAPVAASLANAYLQQFTCSIVRTATELALRGVLDVLDAMLFPPTCDSVKLLSSIWELNFQDRFKVNMINYPEKLTTVAAVPYIEKELRRVAQWLETELGVNITSHHLQAAISIGNRVRTLWQRLYELRSTRGALTWQDHYMLLQAGTFLPAVEYAELLSQVVSGLEDTAFSTTDVPVAVVGLSCQLPHPSLMAKIEELGARIVDDDIMLGRRGIGLVEEEGDPYLNLARAFVKSAPLATRHSDTVKRHQYILNRVRMSGARGVIFMIPKFCEPELFDYRYLKAEFEQAEVPAIYTDFEEDASAAEGLQNRVAAFVEMLQQRV